MFNFEFNFKRVLVFIVVFGALFGAVHAAFTPAPALALSEPQGAISIIQQTQQDEYPSTFEAFLAWLATNAPIAILLSLIAELFPRWDVVDARLKRLVVFGLSAVLGTASALLIKYLPASVIQAVEPYYQIIWNAIWIAVGTQLTHLVAKRLLPIFIGSLEDKDFRG